MFPQRKQATPAYFQAPIAMPLAIVLAQQDAIALMITRTAAARGMNALQASIAARRARISGQLAHWCEQERIALRWRLKINGLPASAPIRVLESTSPATALAARIERQILALIDADFSLLH